MNTERNKKSRDYHLTNVMMSNEVVSIEYIGGDNLYVVNIKDSSESISFTEEEYKKFIAISNRISNYVKNELAN